MVKIWSTATTQYYKKLQSSCSRPLWCPIPDSLYSSLIFQPQLQWTAPNKLRLNLVWQHPSSSKHHNSFFSKSKKGCWVSKQPQPESAGGINDLRGNLPPTRDSSHCSQTLLSQVLKQTSLRCLMAAYQEVLTRWAPAAHGRDSVTYFILPLPHSCPVEWPPKYTTYTRALLSLYCGLKFFENLSSRGNLWK